MNPVRSNTRNNSLPLYRQVEQHLREQIASGALQSGDMLPSVKELCKQFGDINHLTVRQAIKNLTEENLVRSIQGRGSFVTERATRNRRIAIVLPHLEDTIFIRIAKGAQEILEASGVRSLILDSRGSESTEADHIHNLTNLPVDGALIYPISRSNIAEGIMRLKLDGFRFVLVDRYFEEINVPCVVVHNYQGGYESARYLAAKGRRRVGWVGDLHSTPARQRMDGFRSAMNDSNIACPGALIRNVEVEPAPPLAYRAALREGVRRAVDELLQLEPRIDGIVCCDDPSALVVLEKLRESGLRVPEDVAVIGFDDIPEAGAARPSLTTVRQPMQEVGREAARMLLDHMDDKSLPTHKRTLPVELVARESA